MRVLVVTEMFAMDGRRYPVGTEITDARAIAEVEARFPRHVIRKNVPHRVAPPRPAPEGDA